MSGIQWIRDNYRVPAKRGMIVRYTGGAGRLPRSGVITGARGPHLLIRMVGAMRSSPYHPTWEIEYPTPQPNVEEGDGI